MFRLSLLHIILIKCLSLPLWLLGLPTPWAALLFFAPDVWILANLFIPQTRGLVPVKSRFATTAKEVWLTIDDGPDPEDTPQLLDLLDRHQAKATFFLIGRRAAQYPQLVAEIYRRGHEIAHHTHTHPSLSFWCAGPARLARELDQGLAALAPLRPTRFRPPVGIKSFFLAPALQTRGLTCISWSIRSRDTLASDPQRTVARVMRQLSPGSIILMHEGAHLQPTIRVQAIRLLLEQLDERDYRSVIPTSDRLR